MFSVTWFSRSSGKNVVVSFDTLAEARNFADFLKCRLDTLGSHAIYDENGCAVDAP